jgi:hypothetical protein
MSDRPNTNITIHCDHHDVEIKVEHARLLADDWYCVQFSLDALVYLNHEQAGKLGQALLDACQDQDLAVIERNRLNADAADEAEADEGTVPGLNTEL